MFVNEGGSTKRFWLRYGTLEEHAESGEEQFGLDVRNDEEGTRDRDCVFSQGHGEVWEMCA